MKYTLDRHIVIEAPVDIVYSHLADFKKWYAWSPWSVVEPDHEVTFFGDSLSVGSGMSWVGTLIGSGSLTIQSLVSDRIDCDLQFLKPFKSSAKTSFVLESLSDNSTKVTWSMESRMPFFLSFMIKMMKSMIEMDYDRGLMMLKSIVETGTVDGTTTNKGLQPLKGFSYIGKKQTSHMDDMSEDMTEIFTQLMQDLKSTGKDAAHVLTVYPKVNLAKKEFTYVAAISDEALNPNELSQYMSGKVNDGHMIQILHKGSYRYLGNAWSMGMMYLRVNKMKQHGKPFELYYNSPHDTPESELLTAVCFPVK